MAVVASLLSGGRPVRGVVKILAGLVVALLVGGLLVVAVGRVRTAASLVGCRNNLKEIGLSLQNYDDANGHFPTGTVPNADLAPDRRLSWLIEVWPAFMEGGKKTLFDRMKAWDAEDNCPARCSICVDKDTAEFRDDVVGDLKVFLCPANPARNTPPLPGPTHYLGVAGVGEDAAELPLSDPRAGFFGYDRTVSLRDITDGAATTLAVAEAVDGGPWTAGGRATVRGLSVGSPYLGEGAQFASLHRGCNLLPLTQPVITNVLLVDGSVRSLTDSMSPQVFEALATIAGKEEVAP